MLNLKIHFLQTAGGGFGVKSAFLGDFGTFCMLICIMSHIIRSVSDHGKYGIILKLSTVGVRSRVDLVVSVVAMATGATIKQKQRENGHFL